MTTTEAPTYDYWFAVLAGETPPVDQNEPQPGYFRTKRGEPVAIWYEDVVCNIMIGSDKMVALDAYEDVWTRCATRAVTEEQWQTAIDNGWVWHDMDEMIRETLGDNIAEADDVEGIAALLKNFWRKPPRPTTPSTVTRWQPRRRACAAARSN